MEVNPAELMSAWNVRVRVGGLVVSQVEALVSPDQLTSILTIASILDFQIDETFSADHNPSPATTVNGSDWPTGLIKVDVGAGSDLLQDPLDGCQPATVSFLHNLGYLTTGNLEVIEGLQMVLDLSIG